MTDTYRCRIFTLREHSQARWGLLRQAFAGGLERPRRCILARNRPGPVLGCCDGEPPIGTELDITHQTQKKKTLEEKIHQR